MVSSSQPHRPNTNFTLGRLQHRILFMMSPSSGENCNIDGDIMNDHSGTSTSSSNTLNQNNIKKFEPERITTTSTKTAKKKKGIRAQHEIETAAPMEYKQYYHYSVQVDEEQDDKATEIQLCSFKRPHMRAFHCSWYGFFIAFFIWFAISPLQHEIMTDLQLTHQQIWTSNIAGVGGTIFIRIILGPACDKYGARIPMALILCVCSIPTACTGLVNSGIGLSFVRLCIGCAGGCFVMCQYWTSRMFAKEVVGFANALVGGWGNLGGGVTQLVVGAGLYPLFKNYFFDGDASMAWRTVSLVPAVIAFVSGLLIYKISDDCPKGQYAQLKKHGNMSIERSTVSFFREGICNFNTWILLVQYGCCFGTELTMNNAASLYFLEQFDVTTETAAALASIFGFMNLFARGLGGYLSDQAYQRYGMRGRLWCQTVNLIGMGVLMVVFAYQTTSLTSAIIVMILCSIFVQAAEGSTYGIVPYVDPATTGAIAGIVGAGGNTGAVCFSIGFRQCIRYHTAFSIMGYASIVSALCSFFISIKGHPGMFGCGSSGNDENQQQAPRNNEALFTPYDNASRKNGHLIFGGIQPPDCDGSSSSSSSSDCENEIDGENEHNHEGENERDDADADADDKGDRTQHYLQSSLTPSKENLPIDTTKTKSKKVQLLSNDTNCNRINHAGIIGPTTSIISPIVEEEEEEEEEEEHLDVDDEDDDGDGCWYYGPPLRKDFESTLSQDNCGKTKNSRISIIHTTNMIRPILEEEEEEEEEEESGSCPL